jgi:hypothetical protein
MLYWLEMPGTHLKNQSLQLMFHPEMSRKLHKIELQLTYISIVLNRVTFIQNNNHQTSTKVLLPGDASRYLADCSYQTNRVCATHLNLSQKTYSSGC